MGIEHMLNNPLIEVACPKCGFEFQLPVEEALAPLIELELARRVEIAQQQFGQSIREAAQKESDERNRTVLAAKDKLISEMRVQVDELRRKVDSTPPNLCGETQELQLEAMFKTAFPLDRIAPVEKGCSGADIVQDVVTKSGKSAGTILWESKNTKTWGGDWIPKVKRDMREANAIVSVIVSTTLPKGVEYFDRIQDVFVVSVRCVLPLAQVLRQLLIEIALIRASSKQADGKAEQLWSYVSGAQFRNRMLAVVEASVALQGDLDADKRSTARRWARNQQHIDAVVQGIAAMYGDLQGLAGLVFPSVPDSLPEPDSNGLEKAS